jgi:hypothetical protein
MNGKSQPKTISKAFPVNRLLTEVLILMLFGAAAILLRAYLRIPLNLPGHHGLEVMAMLLIGRKISDLPFAASISTVTAALIIFLPLPGLKDPFLPFIFLLMGAVIDLIYRFISRFQENIFLFGILGGIAYFMIPLSRLILFTLTGYPYESFVKFGFAVPLASHFVFGALGGMLAYGIVKTTEKIRK